MPMITSEVLSTLGDFSLYRARINVVGQRFIVALPDGGGVGPLQGRRNSEGDAGHELLLDPLLFALYSKVVGREDSKDEEEGGRQEEEEEEKEEEKMEPPPTPRPQNIHP